MADRIAYDVPALRAPRIPPQSAEKALREGKAVCSGYALLLQALGKATGLEIVYVVGFSRDMDGSVPGIGHAWNAAKVDDKWYLIDATWDAATSTATPSPRSPPALTSCARRSFPVSID